jgi:hypothetical protein
VPLNRAQILNSSDLKKQEVDVPEWGGTVFVRTMTGAQRDSLEGRVKGENRDNIRAYIAASTVCDEYGRLLFTAADVTDLGNKSGAALDRIFEVAISLNKISKGDVEKLEGESRAIPGSDGPTASPSPSA